MNRFTRVFLALLRIAIGWHFLYEGAFKIQSEDAGQQYVTSRYAVQASVARLQDGLQGLEPGDPARLAIIEQWHDGLIKHFKDVSNPLSEEQKARLGEIRDELWRDVWNETELDWMNIHGETLKLTSEIEGSNQFSSAPFLMMSSGPFRPLFRGLVADVEGLERLTVPVAQERLEERYRQILAHYASRGYPFTHEQETRLAALRDNLKSALAATLNDQLFRARIADYRTMLERVRLDSGRTAAAFSQERLEADRKRLDTISGELLGFVNEPLAELTLGAQALATVEQMRAGAPPRLPGRTDLIDWLVKWGLVAIGACLMLGLFTRAAAVAAALQLAMFYFAAPPWPGLPVLSTEGHYLIVNRNLIELLAVLALFAANAGLFGGLDLLLARFRGTQPALKPVPEGAATWC